MVGTGTEKGGGDRASYRDPGTRRPARWRPKVRGEAGPRPAAGRSLGRCWKGGEALGRGRVAEFHLHLPRGSSRACRQEPGSHLCVSDASVQTFSLCFSLPNCAICFLVFEFCGVFMFSGYKSFLRPLISKYFLLVYGLPFYSCNHPSKYQIFSFDEVQFCFFSSINHTFGVLEPRIHSHKVFLRPV